LDLSHEVFFLLDNDRAHRLVQIGNLFVFVTKPSDGEFTTFF
jgi:hypothetical protein